MASLRNRNSAIANIQKVLEFTRNFKVKTGKLGDLKVRSDRLEKYNDDFEKWQTELENDASNKLDFDVEIQRRSDVEDMYVEAKSALMDLTTECALKKSLSEIKEEKQCVQSVRLPEVKIEPFDGDYKKWFAFRDLFNSLIHENGSISKSTKLIYLKSYLVGKASKLCENLDVSDSNYEIAYNLVFTRYEDSKLIIEDLLAEMFNVKSSKKNSSSDLMCIVDTMQTCVRALKSLEVKVEFWDEILIFLVTSKLDIDSRAVWENVSSKIKKPKFSEVVETLTDRAKLLDKLKQNQNSVSSSDSQRHNVPEIRKVKNIQSFSAVEVSCIMCSKQHSLFKCDRFRSLSVDDRHGFVQKSNLCFNCFGRHSVRNCLSKLKCHVCNKKHNGLLHFIRDNPSVGVTPQTSHAKCEEVQQTSSALHVNKGDSTCVKKGEILTHSQILLATVKLNIVDKYGNDFVARGVLDSGSQSCFMTQQLCQLLSLDKTPIWQPVCGIGENTTTVKHQVTTIIKSRVSDFSASLNFLVLPKVTNNLPTQLIDASNLRIPPTVVMADPEFYIPGPIDVLIGAEIYSQLVIGTSLKLCNILPPLQPTVFGHVVIGRVECVAPVSLVTCVSLVELQSQIKRFWETETITVPNVFSISEKLCEEHYCANVKRKVDGRYVVRLPLKCSADQLGESKESALRQFHRLEKRLDSNPILKEQYCEFMNEYSQLGHMELISDDDFCVSKGSYYLPHHCVIKPTSTTTKLRVVFNASCGSSNGISLNDLLWVGPTVQQDLWSILLRFRKYAIVWLADVCKMYRQIEVDSKDRDLQRILWRSSCKENVKSYRLCTVTYGTACAPYLATRTLNQLAIDEAPNYPRASKRVSKDFYVDDLVTGEDNLKIALELRDEFIALMKSGGLHLRKWISNCAELLSDLPSELCESKVVDICALGIKWNPREDFFVMSFGDIKINKILTRRAVYSEIAQLFDPLGLCAPVIFTAKTFMQQLWNLIDISWNDELPDDLKNRWITFRSQLTSVSDICIPRPVVNMQVVKIVELHGFCDASELGFGACVYVRSSQDSVSYKLTLLCAKSKVAPLKKLSIPRLELNAAVLLAELMTRVLESMEVNFNRVVLWSDSKIVLAYLNSSPSRFQTFVANRISKIQDLFAPSMWCHVRSADNPADLVSRGLMPSDLQSCALWWNGPPFLAVDCEAVSSIINTDITDLPEQRVETQALIVESEIDTEFIFERFSSYKRLITISAWCLRFRYNCVVSKNLRKSGYITASELDLAIKALVRVIQQRVFKDDLKSLCKTKVVSGNSQLKYLNPFIDETGLLRVGGRLQKSDLPFEQMHPLLLPAKHKFCEMLVLYEHERNLHAAPQALVNAIRQKFWIVSSKCLAKRVVHNCMRCFHTKPKFSDQIMGQLPSARVNINRAFTHCGVDFFGPINIKYKVRTKVTTKAYGCVFVCFSTKAVHLEIVEDLSTESFIAALRRFIARRGRCSVIYSDNATNFVGANTKLEELKEKFLKQEHINHVLKYCAVEGIKWSFIPARSPHFGGLWEAAVKSAKYHLQRMMTTSTLTFGELHTLIVQVEACMNSRPITALSDDPNDLVALTPAHFLIGEPLTALPEPSLEEDKPVRLLRWTQIQQKMQYFWRRWSSEYIHQCQQRFKWNKSSDNVKIGELVLVKEINLPPTLWALGRIIATHPGTDNIVRVVTIKTMKGTYKRGLSELCPLPSALQPCDSS